MYRTIDAALWTDPKVRQLSVSAKLFFIYLITNPHTHVSGIYILTPEVMTIETGCRRKELDTLSDTLSGAGFCAFDPSRAVVWVRNMFEYQGSGEKNCRSAAYHLVEDLHKTPLIVDFCTRYPRVQQYLPKDFLDGVSIGYPARATPDSRSLIPDSRILIPDTREEKPPASSSAAEAGPVDLFEIYNTHRGDLPKALALTESRRKKCVARLKNQNGNFLTTFTQAIQRAAALPFCCGEGSRGWKVSFDWLIDNDSNFLKILEGKYNHVRTERQSNGNLSKDDIVRANCESLLAESDSKISSSR